MRMRGILVIFALGACSASGQQTVDYYKAHARERAERVDRCLVAGDTSQDCRNAKQADFEASGIAAKDGVAIVR